MKKRILMLAIYIALLAASYFFEWINLDRPDTPSQKYILLPAENTHVENTPKTPVVIFHGFFGVNDKLMKLAEALRTKGRTVIIPKFYDFSPPKDSYSLSKRLPEFNTILEDAEIQSAHLVTSGLGGPIAIQAVYDGPTRFQSLTLLSTSGAQKYELMGDYSLNRALYSLQSLLCWILNNLLPDFGLLKKLPFKQEHFRSLADIDLRPTEGQLREIQIPTLVLHGEKDYMVPPQAAHHHHHLLSKSRLVFFEMSHEMPEATIPAASSEIESFFTLVENDSFAPDTPMKSLENQPILTGPRFWFITGLIFIGTKFSEDLATAAAGLLVSHEILPFWFAVIICFLGIMVGDVTIYFFGRWAGIGILRRRPLCWIINEQQVRDAEKWFEHRGLVIIILSRFIPATRFPVYMATGILGVPPLKFISVLTIAALIWTPAVIGLAAILGAPLLNLMGKYERWSLVILTTLFISLTVLIKLFLPLATKKGRKAFFVRWQRIWRPVCRRKLA